MEGFVSILALVSLGFTIFCIYFIFKVLQFVIMAINLYKKMIAREDSIIRLLMDIRDNTKKFESTIEPVVASASYQDEEYHCEKCNAIIPPDAKKCPKCGVEFE